MNNDTQILTSVSVDELEALAAGVLMPAAEGRLEVLIAGAKQESLSANEAAELDDLLNKVDQLNLLKARACYTIHQLGVKASN